MCARPAPGRRDPLHQGRAVSTGAMVLIVFGLFLVGGCISFVKQGLPKSVVALLAVGAVFSIAAGVLKIG
ncbi:hypothetical protein GTZ85_44035 [Streptomyces sp. SID5474]|nr:hypothetical protein [Streptomyces sp. SID5474]